MNTINYNSHYIDNDDIKAVITSLKSNKITQGEKNKQFEEKLKFYFKSKYCSVVSSGTAALHLCSLVLGFKKNDIILSSPITFLAGPNSVNYCNATIDFVDINDQTYNIDVEKLETKLKIYKKNKKKIKAVIATDYAGQPCNWKKLKSLSKKYKFYLINDNCHAIGAKYLGDIGYAVKYADLVIHSYHAVKNITTGEGGSVLTNNKIFHNKIEVLKSHGLERINKKNVENPNWPFIMKQLGYNFRITDFQCALGISQLKKLNKFLNKRKTISKIYSNSFKNTKNIKIPYISKDSEHAFHLYPILINFKKTKIGKKKLIENFKKENINLQIHYFPIHLQPYYKKKFKFKKGNFPIAEKFHSQVISLPIYFKLKTNEVNKIVKLVKKSVK